MAASCHMSSGSLRAHRWAHSLKLAPAAISRIKSVLVNMSDRGFLFLFSCVVILASLGAAVWLAATGQALSVDGLFLLITCLLIAAAFGLYVMFMIKSAMESQQAPAAKTAKAPPGAQPKSAPLVPAEKAE